MRAAADELLAWEALMDSLVVRYWLIPAPRFGTETFFFIVGMCAGVGSVPTPFLARLASHLWKSMPPPFF